MNHESLLARLAEAEETLQALRAGAVDALVVRGPEGDQVYTLQGAGEPYRNLVEQMREGAVVLTQAGDIVYSNARFAALTGQPLEAVLGAHVGCFIAEAHRGDFNELVRSGSGVRRSRLLCADGTSLEIYLSLTTTRSSTGADTLSLIVTDLTELLQARSERDRAERDSHTKDEFLAMLSHELRNPLGVIRTAAVLLDQTGAGANGAAARAGEVIERQVGHLSRVIEDLLDVERVTSGKIRLDRHPLDMAQAVRQTVATFTANAALDRHIDLRTEPMWIDGDAVRLEQVVANIVTNAVKYTPSGGHIEVSLSAEGDDAVLSVTDTGFGIPPDLLPTIFDMFVQGERTLDRAQGGLGIGLTLVRRLVELHGGTVIASSGGAGHGSTFTVRLPQVRGMSAPGDASSAFDRKAPRRVLLIEDNRDARELFRMVLELAGHSVAEAANGDRALELLNTEQPDVAIIDIGLPGIDGYEVARRIRARSEGREMLLLALTGYGLPRDYERSAESGFDHHLVKPVNLYDLMRLVEAHRVSAGEEIPA